MGIYFFDGFESGAAHLWDGVNASIIAAPSGCSGNYACQINGGNKFLYKRLPVAKTEIYLHFLCRMDSAYIYGSPMLVFLNGSTPIASLHAAVSDPKNFFVKRGFSGDTIATGSAVYSVGSVYRLEVHYKADDSSGVFQLKINGSAVLDIDFSGDSCDSASSFDGILFGDVPDLGLNEACITIDDVVLADSDWVGTCKVQALAPIGSGSSSQHTGDYADVAAVPPNDATKIYTNSNDQLTMFDMAQLAGSVDTIKAVMVEARVKSQGLVAPKNLKLAVRTGGADYLSANKTVVYGGDPRAVREIWLTNPGTSNSWTVPEINGIEIGVKSAE